MTNPKTGTLKAPKQNSTNSTSGGNKKGLSLGTDEGINAKLTPGGKATPC